MTITTDTVYSISYTSNILLNQKSKSRENSKWKDTGTFQNEKILKKFKIHVLLSHFFYSYFLLLHLLLLDMIGTTNTVTEVSKSTSFKVILSLLLLCFQACMSLREGLGTTACFFLKFNFRWHRMTKDQKMSMFIVEMMISSF